MVAYTDITQLCSMVSSEHMTPQLSEIWSVKLRHFEKMAFEVQKIIWTLFKKTIQLD